MARIEPNKKVKTLLASLSAEEKDMVYRKLWYEHVLEDALSFMTENDHEVSEEVAKEVATRYVYDGRYDCNDSYWTNIKLLIEEVEGEK